jgi:hypothetical protein
VLHLAVRLSALTNVAASIAPLFVSRPFHLNNRHQSSPLEGPFHRVRDASSSFAHALQASQLAAWSVTVKDGKFQKLFSVPVADATPQ